MVIYHDLESLQMYKPCPRAFFLVLVVCILASNKALRSCNVNMGFGLHQQHFRWKSSPFCLVDGLTPGSEALALLTQWPCNEGFMETTGEQGWELTSQEGWFPCLRCSIPCSLGRILFHLTTNLVCGTIVCDLLNSTPFPGATNSWIGKLACLWTHYRWFLKS